MIQSLILGGVAGVIGCTVVYPLDLGKTHLQNQKQGPDMYRGFTDFIKRRISTFGLRGLFTGWSANVIGITPEKALKLAINSHARILYRCSDEEFRWKGEVLAGATAGFCQFIATNPMEIMKIRMQVASNPSILGTYRELGFLGLYRGSASTLLRDIPFSALYFPLYSYLKISFKGDASTLSFPWVFLAGTIAGVVGAATSTPADVIKTRLQVQPGEGVKPYGGIMDCTRRIYLEEGLMAFCKGMGPRVTLIAPLFGIALGVFEFLGDYVKSVG